MLVWLPFEIRIKKKNSPNSDFLYHVAQFELLTLCWIHHTIEATFYLIHLQPSVKLQDPSAFFTDNTGMINRIWGTNTGETEMFLNNLKFPGDI